MKRLSDTIIHDQATGPVPDGTPAPTEQAIEPATEPAIGPVVEPAIGPVAEPETAAAEMSAPPSGRRRPRTTSEE